MYHIMLHSICGDTSPLLMQVMWLVWLDKCSVAFPISLFIYHGIWRERVGLFL